MRAALRPPQHPAPGKILDFCGIGRKAAEGFLEQDPVSLTQIDR
jgi:hypothetical protein